MVKLDNDWDESAAGEPSGVSGSHKRKRDDKGGRVYIRAYEQPPSQFLSVFGKSAYSIVSTSKLWEGLNEELKSGALYGSELCDKDEERRGVGINRWASVLRDFLKYQKSETGKNRNAQVLNKDFNKNLYEEIERIYPALDGIVCDARKKQILFQYAAFHSIGLRTRKRSIG